MELIMSENIYQVFMPFCERRYVYIMAKMVKACGKTGLSKKYMLVELNFMANEDGVACNARQT